MLCNWNAVDKLNVLLFSYNTEAMLNNILWLAGCTEKTLVCQIVSDKHRSYLLYAEGKKKIFKCQRKPCRCMTHHINLDVTAHDLFN